MVEPEDVGGSHGVRAARIVDSVGNRRRYWRQQQLRSSRRAAVRVRNISVGAIEVEGASRSRRQPYDELHVQVFKAHLEAVFAPDFCKVVGKLERLAHFISRQEGSG